MTDRSWREEDGMEGTHLFQRSSAIPLGEKQICLQKEGRHTRGRLRCIAIMSLHLQQLEDRLPLLHQNAKREQFQHFHDIAGIGIIHSFHKHSQQRSLQLLLERFPADFGPHAPQHRLPHSRHFSRQKPPLHPLSRQGEVDRFPRNQLAPRSRGIHIIVQNRGFFRQCGGVETPEQKLKGDGV